MKLKMAENSVFAILLRSPWWASLGVALAISVASNALLPERFVFYGVAMALPFAVIAAIVVWRQLRRPSAARLARRLEAVRDLPAAPFMEAVASAYRLQGFSVSAFEPQGADLRLQRAGRTTLLVCRRWRAARLGVEPLRELRAAIEREDASAGIVLSAGEITDVARRFAKSNAITILNEAALAEVLPDDLKPSQKASSAPARTASARR